MIQVSAMAALPPRTLRRIGLCLAESLMWALTHPVANRPTTAIATVMGMRIATGISTIASKGSRKPEVKAIAEAAAACHGLVSSSW